MLYRLILLALFVPLTAQGQGLMLGQSKARKPDSALILHAGQLLVVPGESPMSQQTVVVRNGVITEIRAGFVDPATLDVGKATPDFIDLSEFFVMPGLVDPHVHLAPLVPANRNIAARTIDAVLSAQSILEAGFTTVRDMGSDPEAVFAVRDAIEAGRLTGPTIVAAGPAITTTGSGRASANPVDPDGRARAGICDGADDCRRLARHIEKQGADFLAFEAFRGEESGNPIPMLTNDEMQAVTAAADLRALPVVAHAADTACTRRPGRNADELMRRVMGGMSATDAIVSATVEAAELFEVPGLTGALQPGSRADLIAVAGNPLRNITDLRSVSWVVKSGEVVRRPDL